MVLPASLINSLGGLSMAKTLTQMAADIVAAQASHVSMSADEMDTTLKKVFEVLSQIKALEDMPFEEAVDNKLARLRAKPIKSIQKNYVVNLEDGSKYRQLTAKTLAKFNLTAKEYRKKWGFPARQALSAKSLSAKRRITAKALGLADKLAAARKAKSQAPVKKIAVPAKKKAAPTKKKAARKRKKA
jgi:predicted transcriptional regulator